MLTGEPCAGLSIELFRCAVCGISVNAMVNGAEQETIIFPHAFYVFPQFKRTIEILKETGYPISMDDVDLSSVEVQYYMDEYHNEVFIPNRLRSARAAEGTEKSSEMLSAGTILGKKRRG